MATNRMWDPFGEALSLRDAMSQLQEGSFVRPGMTFGGGAASQTFPINVHGTADDLQVEALLPGVSEEDVQVDINRGVLTIAAKRHIAEHGDGGQWYLREFHPGQYSRSLALPFPIETEQATASFTNGVLTLTLPKAEAAKPKRIQIGAGQPQQQFIEGRAEQQQLAGTAKSRGSKRTNG